MDQRHGFPGELPEIITGWSRGELALVPGDGFWARIEQIAVKGDMTRDFDKAMQGHSSPRIWLFLHEPGRGELSTAAAMSFARELAFRDQAALLLDCDDRDMALTRWAGRVEYEGWIDLARYGTSVLTSGVPMPFVGRRGYLLGVGSFVPTDVTGEEIDALLTRLRRQADDLLLVAPADSVGRLWAPAAAIRIFCWDRQTMSDQEAGAIALEFSEAGCPLTAVATFRKTGPVEEKLVDEILSEVKSTPEVPGPVAPSEPEVEKPVTPVETETVPSEKESISEEEKDWRNLPLEVDAESDGPGLEVEAGSDDLGLEVEVESDGLGLEVEAGSDDLGLEVEAGSDDLGLEVEVESGGPGLEDEAGFDGLDLEVEVEEETVPVPEPVPARETSRVFWFGALAAVVLIAVASIYYIKFVRVPSEGHFDQINIAAETESPVPEGQGIVAGDTVQLEYAIPTVDTDSMVVTMNDDEGDTLGLLAVTEPMDQAVADSVPSPEVVADESVQDDVAPKVEPVKPPAKFDMRPYQGPVGAKGWALHVYSHPDSPGTAKEVKALERQGFSSEVKIFDLGEKGRWFRIYLGSFATKSAAKRAMPALLKKLGKDWANPERFETSAPE